MKPLAFLLRQLQRLPGLLQRAIAAGSAAHTQAALLAANVVVLSIGEPWGPAEGAARLVALLGRA